MPNISEVARLAGVSTATVSKYLNGVKVREENARAIDEAVRTLQFHPNDFARGLRTNRSMSVGILLPELDNLFFTSIISSVDRILDQHGYSTFVCISRSDLLKERQKLEFLRRKKIDGLIAIPCSGASEFVKDLQGLPTVLIDRITTSASCCCVLSDNFSGSYAAAEELIAAGHRRIGLLLGWPEAYTPVERKAGFLAACAARGISLPEQYICTGEYTVHSGYEMAKKLLAMEDPPTALFASNNELTFGALEALTKMGKIPGKNISIVGFDADLLARSFYPRLTVISQNVQEIGKTAAQILLEQIQGKQPENSQVIRIPTKLIRGDSVIPRTE